MLARLLLLVLLSLPALADSNLRDTIHDFLNQRQWSMRLDSLGGLYHGAYIGAEGRWSTLLVVREELETLAFFSLLEEPVPEERRPAVADWIAHTNYGLLSGSFEMDAASGDLRLRTGLVLQGQALTPELLEGLLYVNVALMDRYLPELREKLAQGSQELME